MRSGVVLRRLDVARTRELHREMQAGQLPAGLDLVAVHVGGSRQRPAPGYVASRPCRSESPAPGRNVDRCRSSDFLRIAFRG